VKIGHFATYGGHIGFSGAPWWPKIFLKYSVIIVDK
jgi:hypothetical protein